MFIAGFGALVFGLVIGWISYRTLRLTGGANVLSDIATIIAAVGGAAIVTLLKSDVLFGLYAVGLAIGFFAYMAVGLVLYGMQEVRPWQAPRVPPPAPAPPPVPPSATNPTDVENAS